MRKIYFTVLAGAIISCNNCPKGVQVEKFNLMQDTFLINLKINHLASVLRERGVLLDSNFDTLPPIEKLKQITYEIQTYKPITNQWVKGNPKSNLVKKDSFYEGCMFFSGYNRFLVNKLVLKYNNTIREIPFNDTTFEFRFKVKPYKLGENICKGFMIQGKDTYGFENRFTAIK